MTYRFLAWFMVLAMLSCASKKDVLYLQDADQLDTQEVAFAAPSIQPNDILKITVGALVPEAALPYNKVISQGMQAANLDILKLEGYIVSNDWTIAFPVLGVLSVKDKTAAQLATELKERLESGGHLSHPTVDVRVLNAKFTVLGEVNRPGTYTFTDANLTLLQALGLAGDLTMNGKREDVILIREADGQRRITHINLQASDWLDTDIYQIQPNDVLIVNPNEKAINSSGIVDVSTLLGIASLTLSVVILLTR